MDLNKREYDVAKIADDGAILQIANPFTGDIEMHDGKPVTITVLGMDSPTIQKVVRMQQKRQSRGRKVDVEANGVEILVTATAGWHGFLKGKDVLECTPENIADVYQKFDWIAEQVLEFMRERSNFFTG